MEGKTWKDMLGRHGKMTPDIDAIFILMLSTE